jgi:hypothetical protein
MNIIMNFICPRCLYKTNKKSDIVKHINRVKLCPLSNEGVDIKPKDYNDVIIKNEVTIVDIIKCNEKQKSEIEKLREEFKNELKQLKSQIINVNIKGNNNTTNNTTNNTNSNKIETVNITINNYNEPNLEYIGEKQYRNFMKDFKTTYLKMCREIYFNPKHPENNSIKKTNKKDKYIEYYKDKKWSTGNVKTLLPDIKEVIYEALDKGSMDDRLNELTYELDNNEEFKLKVDTDILAQCLSYINK